MVWYYHTIYQAGATAIPLTKKQIFAAADRLVEGGAKPTLEALRAEVGAATATSPPLCARVGGELEEAREEAAALADRLAAQLEASDTRCRGLESRATERHSS